MSSSLREHDEHLEYRTPSETFRDDRNYICDSLKIVDFHCTDSLLPSCMGVSKKQIKNCGFR